MEDILIQISQSQGIWTVLFVFLLLYTIKKNETLVILMLFILPILPDEVICVGAGLAGIDAYKFIGIAALSKLITSFSLSYSLKLITFDIKTVMVGTVLIMIAVLVNKLSKR